MTRSPPRTLCSLLHDRISGSSFTHYRYRTFGADAALFVLDMTAATDRWQGYAAERLALLQFIVEQGIENVVFITEDIHGPDSDDEPDDRDDYVKSLINEQMARFGYNPLGLDDALEGETAPGQAVAGGLYGRACLWLGRV